MQVRQAFEKAIERRLALGLIRDGTAETYRAVLPRIPGRLLDMQLDAVRTQDVEEAIVWMRARAIPPYSPGTIKQAMDTLSMVYRDAITLGFTRSNPVAGAALPKPSPKKDKNLSDAALKRCLVVARKHPFGFFFRFALGTGMRRGELCGLDWGDIDLAAGTVSVTRSYTMVGKTAQFVPPKTDAGVRKIALPFALLEEARLKGAGKRPTDPVFTSKAGERMHPGWSSVGVQSLLTEAGVDGFTLHSLRHTHATQLVSSGGPLPAIARRLGHSDVTTTMRTYAHPKPEEDAALAKAAEKLF